ncbi:toxin-antitoxin system YwqK family antitoxin [Pontibacter pudoricolor]|uniref:toxin-antitoxin system YwqK family antitoxin n=1 Tax=Pontibacter pudoricolor TaxID=2694930 RepID=UPI001391B4F5|nr:hypothetical protein [Pontibacter pudoricolor]
MKPNLLWCLLLLCSCSYSSKEVAFDADNLIQSISANYDTLNSGEIYELTIKTDSSHFNRFGEDPVIKINDNPYYPLWAGEFTNYVLTEDIDIIPGAVVKKDHKLEIKIKKTAETDTTIHITKTYFVTNLETTPRSEGKLIDGRKNGLWRFWYDNNRKHLKEESSWTEGKKNGEAVVYWKNGNKQQVLNYKTGLQHGVAYFYSSSGSIADSVAYENGELSNQQL